MFRVAKHAVRVGKLGTAGLRKAPLSLEACSTFSTLNYSPGLWLDSVLGAGPGTV